MDGWEFACRLMPLRETSGDFYDFRLLPDKNIGFLVADVMDKGVGAALFMALCWFMIRSYAERHANAPEKILTAVNRRLLQEIKLKQFLTIFYGELNPVSGELVYSNAGHPPPLLITAGDERAITELNRTGMPLGLFRDESWQRGMVRLAAGDVLALYTDGLSEAQNAQGEFFGDRRLREALVAHSHHSAQAILDAILTDLHEFQGDTPLADDIALMIIRRKA